jgi:hypothetical protein
MTHKAVAPEIDSGPFPPRRSWKAVLQGSSDYKLPGLFQWFSGNVGFPMARPVIGAAKI